MAKDIVRRRYEYAKKRAPEMLYDGVAGKLPEWVPDSWEERFYVAQRAMILWGAQWLTEDDAEIGKTILDYAKACLDSHIRDESLPPLKSFDTSIMRDIEISMPTSELELLAHIYFAIEHSKKHGPEAGLAELLGMDIIQAAKQDPRLQRVARFPTPSGTKWEDISIVFVANDTVEIEIGPIKKSATFSQMGFTDRRRRDQADKAWKILWVFARRSGDILLEDVKDGNEEFVKNLPHRIVDIQKRLRNYFGITSNPISSYRSRPAGYRTKFSISDRNAGSELSEGDASRKDYTNATEEEFYEAYPDENPTYDWRGGNP